MSAGSITSAPFQSKSLVASSMTTNTAGLSTGRPLRRIDTRSAMRSQRRSFSSTPRRCGASSSTSASSKSRGPWLSTSEVYANGRPSVPRTSRTIDVLPVTGGPCTNIGIAWSCGSPINPRSCEICSRRPGHRAQRSSLTSAAGAAPAAIAPARVTGGTSFPRSNRNSLGSSQASGDLRTRRRSLWIESVETQPETNK